jgi:hypothetical protein
VFGNNADIERQLCTVQLSTYYITNRLLNKNYYIETQPITVTARSKVGTVFARSDSGIVVSNPTQGMNVFLSCVYSVCVRSQPCDGPILCPRSPTNYLRLREIKFTYLDTVRYKRSTLRRRYRNVSTEVGLSAHILATEFI